MFHNIIVIVISFILRNAHCSEPKCLDAGIQKCNEDALGCGLNKINLHNNETFFAHVTPDVSKFYQKEIGTMVAKDPSFGGFYVKFINLSPEQVLWYWYPGEDRESMLMARVEPFESVSTGSFDGHVFFFASGQFTGENREEIKQWFDVEEGQNVYYYDPFEMHEDGVYWNLNQLPASLQDLYYVHKKNLEFSKQYREYTGINWLSLYPKSRPRHYMWRADYFGQQHLVETRETHFITNPPQSELGHIEEFGLNRRLDDDSKPRLLHSYRDQNPSLNLTLTVLSCAPRVFEIQNFLSEVEINHILHLAQEIELHRSTTGDGEGEDPSVRTSKTAWIEREASPIIDAIYRRAADLLNINEALLRHRDQGEVPNWPSTSTAAENLQLLHYGDGEEYTPHHDAGAPSITDPLQPDRFATLLLYLNEGMVGGSTTFPRWLNAETTEELQITPKLGKAVLFYSYLPDGNLDDLSQHAAAPVLKGEKWLTNLWIWDPHFDY